MTIVAEPDRSGVPITDRPTGVNGLKVYSMRTDTRLPFVLFESHDPVVHWPVGGEFAGSHRT